MEPNPSGSFIASRLDFIAMHRKEGRGFFAGGVAIIRCASASVRIVAMSLSRSRIPSAATRPSRSWPMKILQS
jgi:hypothetical protein